MSIANRFDCPYHFKNFPCKECEDNEEDILANLREQDMQMGEYFNR